MDEHQKRILDHYKNPRNLEPILNITHKAESANLSCGDSVCFELFIKDSLIYELQLKTEGCSICVGSASILGEMIKNRSLEYISTISEKDILVYLGIYLKPTREKCALLGLKDLNNIAKV